MANQVDSSEVIEAFSCLPWHDSKLLGFAVSDESSGETVVTFDVVFRPVGGVGGRAEVRFNNARGIHAEVDLLAKSICSDHIASGTCEKAEESAEEFVCRLDERIDDLYPGETMEGLFLFFVDLIHPGGKVLVLARTFSVTARAPEPPGATPP
ncbi:MAG TPA: hypothetical protein VEO74_14800 [Thermoanaerobaculia bacterium]|nr:hypothetical protein [Thermoanaerobaculia bacterium]